MDVGELVTRARAARRRAYAPYSTFAVGAAVLAGSGRVYTGCNVENASYAATLCAERVALAKAVSEGERRLSAVCVVAGDPDPVPPCGVCLQSLQEFGPDMQVVMAAPEGDPVIRSLASLLPHAFAAGHLARGKAPDTALNAQTPAARLERRAGHGDGR